MSFYTNHVATGAVAVSPNNTTQVDFVGLYIGVAGDVTVTGGDGVDVTFPGVPAGKDIPMLVTRVKSSGTTASSIVGYRA
jgi:hypothetical protein